VFKKIFSFFIILISLKSNATEPYRGFQFGVFPGYLIAHREYMANMAAHTYGFEAVYTSNHTGWNNVDNEYKHLKWGTGFSYFNLGNKELNGNTYAWHIFVEANLKKREKFQSSLRFGSGVGYFNKPFDFQNNKKNKAIGSGFNGNMQVMYNTYFDISKMQQLVLGFGVTHYSNGNFKRPNLGINMAHFNFGMVQKFDSKKEFKHKDLPLLFPKNGIELALGFANKQIAVADTRRFNIYSGSLVYYKTYQKNRIWRLGSDIFIDKTYPYELFRPETLNNLKISQITEVAIKAGHEFTFGRISIVTDLGTYLYRPSQFKKRTYFKIGFNYFFNKGISAQTRLKSHMAVADYFHWGAAYRFNPFNTKNEKN
jgi:hypothetical protein